MLSSKGLRGPGGCSGTPAIVNNHNKDDLKRIYNNDLVLTRYRLPDIMTYLKEGEGEPVRSAAPQAKPAAP